MDLVFGVNSLVSASSRGLPVAPTAFPGLVPLAAKAFHPVLRIAELCKIKGTSSTKFLICKGLLAAQRAYTF